MMGVMDLLVNQGVSPGKLLRIILCMLPEAVLFSMPAACLMSVMLAFIRLAGDNEIIALNASGVSLYQMLPPVIFFSLISFIFSGVLALYGVPWGNMAYKDYLQGIVKSTTNFPIKERVFYEPLDKVVFYVNSYSSSDNEMKNIFVVDRTNDQVANTIVAEKGIILKGQGSNTVAVHFINGTIFTNSSDFKDTRTARFKTLERSFDLGGSVSKKALKEKKPGEMSVMELIGELKKSGEKTPRRNEMGVKLFEMFSIPLAIFIMGIIGSSLGSHVKARGRTAGVVISLIVFIIYYMSLMGSRYLCEMGAVAPYLGVWPPVLLLAGISLFLLSTVKKSSSFILY